MKKISLLVSLLLLIFGAANVFACPDAPTGPYYFLGATIYDYSQAQGCYSFYGSGTASTTTLSCATQRDGWSLGVGNYSAMRTSFTIGSSDPVVNANNWVLNFYVDLISPAQTSFDYFAVTAYVTHSNNSLDTYTLFTWNGSQGDMTCAPISVGPFSANHGDTVTIEFRGTNFGSGATMKASVPLIEDIS